MVVISVVPSEIAANARKMINHSISAKRINETKRIIHSSLVIFVIITLCLFLVLLFLRDRFVMVTHGYIEECFWSYSLNLMVSVMGLELSKTLLYVFERGHIVIASTVSCGYIISIPLVYFNVYYHGGDPFWHRDFLDSLWLSILIVNIMQLLIQIIGLRGYNIY